MVVVTAPEQLRAWPTRSERLLELVLERAATVTEMAQAVDRPKSTVAYHVNLLVRAGLLRVGAPAGSGDRRAFYGRVAAALHRRAQPPRGRAGRGRINGLAEAAAESAAAHAADDLRCTAHPSRCYPLIDRVTFKPAFGRRSGRNPET